MKIWRDHQVLGDGRARDGDWWTWELCEHMMVVGRGVGRARSPVGCSCLERSEDWVRDPVAASTLCCSPTILLNWTFENRNFSSYFISETSKCLSWQFVWKYIYIFFIFMCTLPFPDLHHEIRFPIFMNRIPLLLTFPIVCPIAGV